MNNNTKHVVLDASSKTYTIIDNWLLDSNLSCYEKIVYIILKRFSYNLDSRVFPSHKTIAKLASVSIDTVKRALDSLTQKKLIRVKSHKELGSSNIYILCDPSQRNEQINLNPVDLLGVGYTRLQSRPERITKANREELMRNTPIENLENVCVNCLLNFQRTEVEENLFGVIEVCPKCKSDQVVDTKKTGVSCSAIKSLRDDYEAAKICSAIDVMNQTYAIEEIKNPTKLLLGILKRGVLIPTNYTDPKERKKKAQEEQKQRKQKEKLIEEQKKIKMAKNQEEELLLAEAEKKMEAMSETDREILENEIKLTYRIAAKLPQIVRSLMIDKIASDIRERRS